MFKTFDPSRDIKDQTNSINEVLVYNGAIFTGTTNPETNIKKFAHWVSGTASGSYYQALYNENFTSSVANELLNITYGQSISSSFYNSALAVNKLEKNKMYRLHAKMLLGDEDYRFNISGSDRDELIFIHVKRDQMKDEIKKGSVSLLTMFSGGYTPTGIQVGFNSASMNDSTAISTYSQTIRGDVGNLTTGSLIAGQIYYQAGEIVLIPEIFSNTSSVSTNIGNYWSGAVQYSDLVTNSSYESILNGIRYRVKNLTLINQSNLHSTFYFCRAQNDEFNYSSNPTFLDSAQRIIPTSGSNNLQTRTYPTKVALLGQNGEVLTVASIGRPIKKTPDSEFSLKVRLDQ